MSVVTGVLFGLAPAVQTSNVDLAAALKEAGRDGMAAGSAQRFRSALVTVQIGLALMLLIGRTKDEARGTRNEERGTRASRAG
jgi:hypothetical protein